MVGGKLVGRIKGYEVPLRVGDVEASGNGLPLGRDWRVVLVAVVLKKASKADSFSDVLVLVSTHTSARRY